MEKRSCPLCNATGVPHHAFTAQVPPGEIPDGAEGAWRIECPHCSPFYLSNRIDRWLTAPELHAPTGEPVRNQIRTNIKKIQAVLHERRSQGLAEPWLHFGKGEPWPVFDQATYQSPSYVIVTIEQLISAWPSTVTERLDRALMNLARASPTLGTQIQINRENREHLLFATDEKEAFYLISALESQGFVKADIAMGWSALATLTPDGWAHVASLQSSGPAKTNPAVVAMWFGGAEPETPAFMRQLFDEAIHAAIASAGYKGDRVDLAQHNDFIMDKVMGMIRVAPFVVADFTGNRGGVYLEAGFARGLGIPVIHTCRQSHFNAAHFDIKQINTIQWEKPEELKEKLFHRIEGTIGRGPYKTDSSLPLATNK